MFGELIEEVSNQRFRQYLIGITRNIQTSFSNSIKTPFWVLHLLAILLTIPLVIFKIDWYYFIFFRWIWPVQVILFPAVIIGGLVPIFFPAVIYLYGKRNDIRQLEPFAFAMAQAAVVGLFWSALYKAFTGRVGPEFQDFHFGMQNYSNQFSFGFLIGGVFDGWPSGHTTIAWALGIVFFKYSLELSKDTLEDTNIITWLLQNRNIGIVYALYVGFGVSTSIHWFSDFIAGSLIGITIGLSVTRNYRIGEKELEEIQTGKFDNTVKTTMLIIFLTIVFSILIPREHL